jgi:hypothetical protein
MRREDPQIFRFFLKRSVYYLICYRYPRFGGGRPPIVIASTTVAALCLAKHTASALIPGWPLRTLSSIVLVQHQSPQNGGLRPSLRWLSFSAALMRTFLLALGSALAYAWPIALIPPGVGWLLSPPTASLGLPSLSVHTNTGARCRLALTWLPRR